MGHKKKFTYSACRLGFKVVKKNWSFYIFNFEARTLLERLNAAARVIVNTGIACSYWHELLGFFSLK